uniref:GH16 domain-containing protein n=1 Tax=Psilocybe cubensis TaxID=181762 RepID=A0A8H7XZ25_PSICU
MSIFGSKFDHHRRYEQSSPSHSVTNLINHSTGSNASFRGSRPPSSQNSVSPYDFDSSRSSSAAPSISDKFPLPPDPTIWGTNISPDQPEEDDALHEPDAKGGGHIFTTRGLINLGCLAVILLGLLALFVGYPLITYFQRKGQSRLGGYGTNASGQVPELPGNRGLIDPDTPADVYFKPSAHNPKVTMQLVFSDEFNVEGRTFYPGEDPYWEAADLHYWQTNNLEYWDPEAVTTANGALEVTLKEKDTHGLSYEGGMMSTWNKFCFTGGLVETSVTLPGRNDVAGLWPAIWALGNLGRAGYGASLEGMWPYTYDACDVGTVANQTFNGEPVNALTHGDPFHGGTLSYLPGQRLSRCTCPGESHPGPKHKDGTFVGRAAPEIDIFEAQVVGTPLVGEVSQSAQWAPFNHEYYFINTSDTYSIVNSSKSFLNTYVGSVFQQATSVVSYTNPDCYEMEKGCFSVYGFEYKPGFDDAYITWISDDEPTWTLLASGMDADPDVQISARPIPQEPMYLIINLGMSENFGTVDLDNLKFPTKMRVDWIRVYQPKGSINIGCDPKDFPTQAYINQYIEAYTNKNLTTWVDDYKQPMPKNRFLGEC